MDTPLFLGDLPCGGVYTSEMGRIVGVNEEFTRITGWTQEQLEGELLDAVLSGGARIFCQTHLWPLLIQNGRIAEVYFHLRHKEGRRVPTYANARVITRDGKTRILWVFFSADERRQFEAELIALRRQSEESAEQLQDAHERLRILNSQLQEQVSKTAQENQELGQQVLTDSLTGLGNRRSLQESARQIAGVGSYSVLMVDADHFKQVNDRYGHDRGDEVLKDIAQCLFKSARQVDSVVRYGGEEFVLILPETRLEQAEIVASRIHASIAECRPGGLPVTVSIGAATSDSGQDDLYLTIKCADEALYQAKAEGRNRTVSHRCG